MVRRRIQKISFISLPNSSLPQKLYIVTAARLVHVKIPVNVSSDVNDNEQATLTLPMGTSMKRNKRLTLHTVNSVTPQGACLATLPIWLYMDPKNKEFS